MRISISLFAACLILAHCFASKPVRMQIVTAKGDTINGTTFFLLKKQNPEIISFTSSDGNSKKYSPKEIKAFITDDDLFISDSVNLDMKYAESINISTNFSDRIVKDTLVFLRVLVKGKLSLFLFRDINGKDHFFVNDGNGYMELVNKIVGSYTDETNHSIHQSRGDSVARRSTYSDSRYKDQLRNLMLEMINDSSRIFNTHYNENDLTKLLSDYNKIVAPLSSIYSQKLHNYISNYLYIGAFVSTVKFSAVDFYTHTEDIGNATSSITPVIGFSIPIQLRRRSDFLNLVPEFMLRQYDYKCDYTHGYISRHAHFGQLQLKGNLAFQSQFNLSKIVSPIVNAGFTIGVLLHSINELESYNNDPRYNTYYSRESKGKIFANVRTLDNGFFISAGSKIKKFIVQFRYEHAFPGIEFNGQYNFYYFLFGYRVK